MGWNVTVICQCLAVRLFLLCQGMRKETSFFLCYLFEILLFELPKVLYFFTKSTCLWTVYEGFPLWVSFFALAFVV